MLLLLLMFVPTPELTLLLVVAEENKKLCMPFLYHCAMHLHIGFFWPLLMLAAFAPEAASHHRNSDLNISVIIIWICCCSLNYTFIYSNESRR